MNETETWTDRVHRLKNEEIDRLRAENARLEKLNKANSDGWAEAVELNNKALTPVEADRLRTEVAEERVKHALTLQSSDEKSADIERLRAEHRTLTESLIEEQAETARMHAENAALRKGIQDYLDGNYAGTHSKKVNQCPHGWYKWEVCQACIDKHFNDVLNDPASG